MPSAGLLKKPVQPTISKSKAPGPIEAEANYRKNFPGAGDYSIPASKTWDQQNEKKYKRGDFSKSPRVTAGVEIENQQKRGNASPGPQAYKENKLKFLPSIPGKSGLAK